MQVSFWRSAVYNCIHVYKVYKVYKCIVSLPFPPPSWDLGPPPVPFRSQRGVKPKPVYFKSLATRRALVKLKKVCVCVCVCVQNRSCAVQRACLPSDKFKMADAADGLVN